MIVRMARIAVIGPRELLLPVLAAIERQSLLQIDRKSKPGRLGELEPALGRVNLDQDSLALRLHYEELRHKIETLLACLPPNGNDREYYLDNEAAARFLAEVVDRHLSDLQRLMEEKEKLVRAQKELAASRDFLAAISPLLVGESKNPLLEHLGVSIRDPKALEELKERLEEQSGLPMAIATVGGPDGELVGVISAEREVAAMIRKNLSRNLVLEHELPPELAGLSVTGKIAALAGKEAENKARQEKLTTELADFSRRWQGIYRQTHAWLAVRLSLLAAFASVYQSRMCFFIFGWITKEAVAGFREKLTAEFAGKVTVEEKEIMEQELARVPTVLRNPAYFQPFEIFSRLLPMPGYAAFDLTPYIGLFFPLFFGMMLGDIGYGFIAAGLGLSLVFRKKSGETARDAGKILVVCGAYAMFFGLLYGELLGNLGAARLGLEPLLISRHEAILPSFYFALAAGLVHISLALLLGGLSARRKGEPKEAAFKFISIIFILLAALFAATWLFPTGALWQKPLLAGLGLVIPALFITGGLLAPLEAIKHLGNVISYARIMAIGLTSVLLAHVANHLAGMAGSIWLGILLGTLLHGFNLLLGIFAPTIHALRLHFVEFFSKTMDSGGHEFSPLGEKKTR